MRKELWEWIKAIVIAVILAAIIRLFIFEVFLVEGSSMQPTLLNGERLIVNKFHFFLNEPVTGDVLVFNFSGDRDFIKRVIAVGGDEIQIKNGSVFLNGVLVVEDHILESTSGNFGPVVVPENTVFVMGDNRNNSMDSRDPTVGFISREQIKGKAFLVFWPPWAARLIGG